MNKKLIAIILSTVILAACEDSGGNSSKSQSKSEPQVQYQNNTYHNSGFRNYNMDGARQALITAGSSYAFSPLLQRDPNDMYHIDAAAVPVGYGCTNKQITGGGQEVWLKPAVMTTSAERLKARREHFDPLVKLAAIKHSLDPNFIHGIISQESAYQPDIQGPETRYGTAKGMMQLIDDTAKAMGVQFLHDIYKPEININAGSKYLAMNMKRFNGNLALVAAAYNAGPGNISRCGNRISPYAKGQTLDYVEKVIGYANAIHQSNSDSRRKREDQ